MLLMALLAIHWVQAQIVNIPDPNFKSALLIHDPVIDTNNDGEIQVNEALAVIELNVEEQEISDPTGVAAFENLQILNFEYNLITAIDLSNNTALEQLYVGQNELTALDVSLLPNLISLAANENQIQNIDVGQNTELISLFLNDNLLSDVDLSLNQSLEVLNLSWNNLETIDLTSNQELILVFLDGSNLVEIDVSMLPLLEHLELRGNNLSEIDVTNNLLLEILDLDHNDLDSIDVSLNTNLTNLSLENNQLDSLDVTNNSELYHLSLNGNNVTSIDLSNNDSLWGLWINSNQLTELDLTPCVGLNFIAAMDNQIEFIDTSQCPLLQWFTLSDNPLETVDFSQNPNLNGLRLNNTLLTSFDISNNPAISIMHASNNDELTFANLKNGNNETMGGGVNFENCPMLQFICVDDVEYAQANFTQVPPGVTFIENCNIGTGEFNRISGLVSFDEDENGCDQNDPGISNLLVATVGPQGDFGASSQFDGNYEISVFEGTYQTTVLGLPEYFSLVPEQYEHTFVGFEQSEVADFCVVANQEVDDLVVSIVPIGFARPGFEAEYLVTYENVGSTPLGVTLRLSFDEERINFESADPSPDEELLDQLSWSLGLVAPFETGVIPIRFRLEEPPVNESGDVLTYIAAVTPDLNDATPLNNVYKLDQVVVNSQDPNDKLVAEGEEVLIEDAQNYLHYTVRFQNIGTASAINVRIEDQLDELLDWTSFRLLESSHPMVMTLQNGLLDFWFEEINLPSVEDDPEGSQGYVVFKIKPVPGIEIGDQISNDAAIFFDFNSAIVTNTVTTTFVDDLGTEQFSKPSLNLYPNPTNAILNIHSDLDLSRVGIYTVNGQIVRTQELTGRTTNIDISSLTPGLYFARLYFTDGQMVSRKLLVE